MVDAGRRILPVLKQRRSRLYTVIASVAMSGAGLLAPTVSTAASTALPAAASSQAAALTQPYFACGRAAPGRAQCLAIVDPKLPAGSAASAASPAATPGSVAGEPQVFCREVFTGGEFESCGTGADHGFSPQDLQSAYRLPAETAGSGQTVAVVDAYDDPNAQADLDVYRSTYGLPPCEAGCFSKVNQEGASSYPPASRSWAVEISLDLDMVSAACPKCHILLVEANDETVSSLAAAENEAATLGATEISNSYGAPEIEMTKGEVETYAGAYSHAGIPITTASGDEGYESDNPEHKNEKGECTNCSTSFPASLTSVISVGGTNLEPTGTSGRGWTESVWLYSGGGCALYLAAKSPWQTDKGCAKRTDNDVAAISSLTTPVSAYDTYSSEPGWQDLAGTSAASPLVASAIALESSAQRAEGAEGIYKHPGNWYDVTEGLNWTYQECPAAYLCHGEVGYDGPSGVGTPDGGAASTPPSAWTEAASNVTSTAGVLNGVVDPEAGAEAKYYFQYGSSAYYGRTVPLVAGKVAGYTAPVRVSQAVSGLKASSEYHFRVVIKTAAGTTYGADRTFSTAPKVYATTIGSKGPAEGQFGEPTSTALNSEGDLWVADYTHNRVEEFSSSGTFIRSCGKAGTGEGQFEGPRGIAVTPGGKVYVSDSRNNRIEVIGPECSYIDSFGSGYLSNPAGLAFTAAGSRGLVLVANSGDNEIEEFSTTAEEIAGKLVQKHEGSYGTKGAGEGQFNAPSDVILGGKESASTQSFYVVDSGNSRVVKFTVTGLNSFIGEEKLSYKFVSSFGSEGSGEGQFSSPKTAVLDPSTGELDVADSGNNRIEQFLTSGSYVGKFGVSGEGALSHPSGIAAAANGNLYVADTANGRVSVWKSSEASAPEWTLASTPTLPHALNSYLWGVSCVSETTTCSAVGDFTVESGGESEALAESWNGTEWSTQTITSPTRYTTLDGVSCPAASTCTSVGLDKSTAGPYVSLAEAQVGGKWKTQTVVEPSGSVNSGLDAVACTSTSACTAVGEYETSAGAVLTFAERWNGAEWKLQTAPAPAGATEAFPTGVACTSSTSCTMVGTYKAGAGPYTPFAEGWNGSEWKLQSVPAPAGATSTRLRGVACTASSACSAAGYYVNSSSVEVTLIERWNGTSWSIQATPNPPEAKASSLGGVSCAGASSCTAVGADLGAAGKWVTLAEVWNGSEWKLTTTPNSEKGEGWLTGGVSCAAAPLPCVAVGNSGSALAEVYG